MWNSKSCPRCRGNIVIDEDISGRFEKCLQCGYERNIVRPSLMKGYLADKKAKKAIVSNRGVR